MLTARAWQTVGEIGRGRLSSVAADENIFLPS